MHVAQSSVPVAMRTKKPKVSEYQARFQSWASSANSNNNNNVIMIFSLLHLYIFYVYVCVHMCNCIFAYVLCTNTIYLYVCVI